MYRWILPFSLTLVALLVWGSVGCRDRAEPVVRTPTGYNGADGFGSQQKSPRPSGAPSGGEHLAGTPVQSTPVHLVEHSGRADGPVPYLVIEPTSATPETPVVLALHGRGDHADQFARLVRRLRLPMRVLVGRAPLPFGPGRGAQWFDLRADGAQGVVTRVADVVAWMSLVRSRYPQAGPPIVLGFSQGAMLALQTVALHPGALRAVVALSGDLRAPKAAVKAAVGVPVLMTSGHADRLVPPSSMDRSRAQLEALGHEVELLRFEGAHGVPRSVRDRVRSFLMALDGAAP